jgi:hypothetical protein
MNCLHVLMLSVGVLLSPLLSAAPAEPLAPPMTYVVAPNGNDDNPGTEEQPWATLKKAAASVNPGDTVLIKAGAYSGAPTWQVRRAGRAGSPITYRAFGDGEVRISASSVLPADGWKRFKGAIYQTEVSSPAAGVFQNGLPLVNPGANHPINSVEEMYPNSCFKSGTTLYVWLQDGSDPKGSEMRTAPSHVVSLHACHYTVFDGLTLEYGLGGFKEQKSTHDVTIRHCVLRYLTSNGIQPIPANCLIEGNRFQMIGATKFQHGMYGGSPGMIVRHNVFEQIAGASVHQYGDPAGGKPTEIYGNVFQKPRKFTAATPRERYHVELLLWSRDHNLVYNNVFYGEGKRPGISLKSHNRVFHNTFVACPTAIDFYKESQGNRVYNNIFLDAGRSFLAWSAEALPQSLDYNLYYARSGAPKWKRGGAAYATFSEYQQAAGETHSLYADPLLAGPADARLKPGSPAIAAGTVVKVGLGAAEQEIAEDIEGTPRPKAGAPTLGAYEFQAERP